MVRNTFFLSALCCFLIFTQSCIHGDLDDCPPMVNYAVAFKYTHNAWDTDRLYDDTKKINLYVFDKDNLVYTTATKLSPDVTHFTIPLDLPMGNYHILAWGNLLETQPFTITPTEFVKGQTKLSDARLTLQRDATNHIHDDLDKLFFGEMNVEIPLYVSRTDTVPLINDTKHVRVVIHWDHSGELRATQQVVDYDDVHLHIDASNAIYNFDNLFTGVNNVVYDPYEYEYEYDVNRSIREFELPAYFYSSSHETTNSCIYEFTILRMMTNRPIMLKVERVKKIYPAPFTITEIDIVQTFQDVFESRGVRKEDRQAEFDKYDNYRIDFYLKYDEIAGEYK